MTSDGQIKAKGPQFIRFLMPIIEVLRKSGGSGTSSEVTDKVIERLDIPDEELTVILKSGQSRVYNQVHWARMYLVNGDLVDSSKRGVWTLTEEGNKANLQEFDSLRFFKEVHERYRKKKRSDAPPERYSQIWCTRQNQAAF
jgi:restriction system protein